MHLVLPSGFTCILVYDAIHTSQEIPRYKSLAFFHAPLNTGSFFDNSNSAPCEYNDAFRNETDLTVKIFYFHHTNYITKPKDTINNYIKFQFISNIRHTKNVSSQ